MHWHSRPVTLEAEAWYQYYTIMVSSLSIFLRKRKSKSTNHNNSTTKSSYSEHIFHLFDDKIGHNHLNAGVGTGIHREITYVIISHILITINRLIWLDNGQKSVHVITQDKNHIPWNKTHIPTPRSYRSLTGKRQRHSERITCCGCGF